MCIHECIRAMLSSAYAHLQANETQALNYGCIVEDPATQQVRHIIHRLHVIHISVHNKLPLQSL